jgi:hypothetical protein
MMLETLLLLLLLLNWSVVSWVKWRLQLLLLVLVLLRSVVMQAVLCPQAFACNACSRSPSTRHTLVVLLSCNGSRSGCAVSRRLEAD